jgi:hypothetical protein
MYSHFSVSQRVRLGIDCRQLTTVRSGISIHLPLLANKRLHTLVLRIILRNPQDNRGQQGKKGKNRGKIHIENGLEGYVSYVRVGLYEMIWAMDIFLLPLAAGGTVLIVEDRGAR